jgi:hypothetical protein
MVTKEKESWAMKKVKISTSYIAEKSLDGIKVPIIKKTVKIFGITVLSKTVTPIIIVEGDNIRGYHFFK